MSGVVSHQERKFKRVSSLTTDSSGGITPADGEVISVTRFYSTSLSQDTYVHLCWDYDGQSPTTLVSNLHGSIDLKFDTSDASNQFTGDGSKSLKIIIVNNSLSESPYIGGIVEVVTL